MLIDNQYTRDALGRITHIQGIDDNDTRTYTYDGFDRLASATNAGDPSLNESFTYQKNGNLVSRSRLANNFVYPPLTGSAVRPHAPLSLGSRTGPRQASRAFVR